MEALKSGRLSTVRFAKIAAETGREGAAKGGTLHLDIRAGLKSSSELENRAIGHVGIIVTGVPKGIDDRNVFAFRIEAVVEGNFEWESAKDMPDLKNPLIVQMLCQNLHTLGVLEVETLAGRLGYSNVTIPWQLDSISKDAPATEEMPTKPRSIRAETAPKAKKTRIRSVK